MKDKRYLEVACHALLPLYDKNDDKDEHENRENSHVSRISPKPERNGDESDDDELATRRFSPFGMDERLGNRIR